MNKVKRTAAIIGVILILSMYAISLISAFFATEYSSGLFIASVFLTVVIPIMVYGFIEIYKLVHRNDKAQDTEDTASDKIK